MLTLLPRVATFIFQAAKQKKGQVSTVFSDNFQFGPEPPVAEMFSREGQEPTAMTWHGHMTNERKARVGETHSVGLK